MITVEGKKIDDRHLELNSPLRGGAGEVLVRLGGEQLDVSQALHDALELLDNSPMKGRQIADYTRDELHERP